MILGKLALVWCLGELLVAALGRGHARRRHQLLMILTALVLAFPLVDSVLPDVVRLRRVTGAALAPGENPWHEGPHVGESLPVSGGLSSPRSDVRA